MGIGTAVASRLAMSIYVGALMFEAVTLPLAIFFLPHPLAVAFLAFQVDCAVCFWLYVHLKHTCEPMLSSCRFFSWYFLAAIHHLDGLKHCWSSPYPPTRNTATSKSCTRTTMALSSPRSHTS